MKILKADLLKALDYPHLVFHQFVASDRYTSQMKVSKVPNLNMSPEARLLAMRLGADIITVAELSSACGDYIESATFDQVRMDSKGDVQQAPSSPQDYLVETGRWLDLLSCLGNEYYMKDESEIIGRLKSDVVKLFPSSFEIKSKDIRTTQ